MESWSAQSTELGGPKSLIFVSVYLFTISLYDDSWHLPVRAHELSDLTAEQKILILKDLILSVYLFLELHSIQPKLIWYL
jgi:hypothetical protein